jgi:hypothetical protein
VEQRPWFTCDSCLELQVLAVRGLVKQADPLKSWLPRVSLGQSSMQYDPRRLSRPGELRIYRPNAMELLWCSSTNQTMPHLRVSPLRGSPEFGPSAHTPPWNIPVGDETGPTLARHHSRCRASPTSGERALHKMLHTQPARGAGTVGYLRHACGTGTVHFKPLQSQHATCATPRHPNRPGERQPRTGHSQP